MSDFVRLPLQKKFNRRNIISRLERVERGEHTATPSSRVANLAELAKEITGARFIAVGDDGTIRMVMSGNELLDLGVAAHLAGFDNTGTAQFYVDADDGRIVAGGGDVNIDQQGVWIENQQAALGFEDTSGNRFNLYLYSDASDNLGLINDLAGKDIVLYIRTTDNAQKAMVWGEAGVANQTKLLIPAGAGGAYLALGGGIDLMSDVDGEETVFNENSYDVDFRIEGASDANLFTIDAGLDAIGIGTSSSSDYKVRIAGTTKVQNIRTRATTLADDTAVNITPSESDGIMNVYTQGANDWAVVRYNTATPSNVSIEVGSNTNVTTGVLAGTTGTDTKFTVSCSTDGDIYVENRTGSSRSVYVLLI